MPSYVTHLECSATGAEFPPGRVYGLSPAGKPLLVRYDLAGMAGAVDRDRLTARPPGMWRYRELLPVPDGAAVSLGEVATPLIPVGRWAPGAPVVVKDEGRLPTGSFKARGLAVAVSMAKVLGVARLAMPTNGNAGAALAAYAACAGLEAHVFCPADTPEVNVREAALAGARVTRVAGLIDDCARLVAEDRDEVGWFDVATLKEPYRLEGKKTMGFELADQLGWELPDVIFYPTGGGTGLIGMWKAFAELAELGWVGGTPPRMVAVQAAGCAPIVRAWERGADHADRWEGAATIAAGIRVPAALGDFLILRALRESGGFATAVTDGEILAARDEVAAADGLLLCPEGAATAAAYCKARDAGLVAAGERAVLFNCASALKYPMPPAGAGIVPGT